MATGLEMYDALKRATHDLEPGALFVMHTLDATDLRKLTVTDLLARDYARTRAEEVSAALVDGNFEPLGRSIGIRLEHNHDAARLLAGAPRTMNVPPEAALVFGSSKDVVSRFWRVWTFDLETRAVIPLAHYDEQTPSDVAANDLAVDAAHGEEPQAIDEILANRHADPTPLPENIAGLLAQLADDTIRMSETPARGQASINVRHTPHYTVYLVRFA